MKIRLLVTLAAAAAMSLACSQTGQPPPTRLSGTNAVVASGQFVFVTSTASNELRVLDLQPVNVATPVDYARAPNPISPLSIPTVSSPIDLATPTRYGPLGQPNTGDWIFARGAGSPAVSVIGAVNCPQQLREFGQITPRLDSVITAMTSRLTADDRLAYLYLATFDGQESTLWEVVLPNQPRDRSTLAQGGNLVSAKTCGNYPGLMPAYTLRAIAPIPGAVVTAMVALPTVWNPTDRRATVPGPLPEETRIVIGTRLLTVPPNPPGNLSEEGMITVIDPTGAGSVSPFPLLFAPYCTLGCSDVPLPTPSEYFASGRGFPVKKLLTHGNVVQVLFDVDSSGNAIPDAGLLPNGLGVQGGVANVVLDAGTRVFAIVDEAACGGLQDCVGILAIDLDRPASDGGFLAVARDGMDSLIDLIGPDGGVILDPTTGLRIRDVNGYYRPPNVAFFDGGIPTDVNRMIPIKFGNNFASGIIQDMTLQSSGVVVDPLDPLDNQIQIGLLGIATISGAAGSTIPAQIFVFDALSLRQLNFTNTAPVSQQKAVLADGTQAIFDGGPTDVQIGQGIWPFSESIFVLYEGIVGGVSGEPLDAGLGNPSAGVWPVSVNSRNVLQQFVLPNDILVPVDSTGTECLYAFPLLGNGADGGLGGVLFEDDGGVFLRTRNDPLSDSLANDGILTLPDGGRITVASGCSPPFSYNVRSSGLTPLPLTVSGTRSGFLGRVAIPDGGTPQTTFQLTGQTFPSFPRFWRPGADAGTPSTVLPSVGFGFNLRNLNPQQSYIPAVEPVLAQGDTPEIRGSGYEIDFVNGFAPGSVGIDQVTLNISLVLPGSVALYQRQVWPIPTQAALGVDRVFVLYPGSNSILDFSPTTVIYTSVNSTDIGLHF